MAGRNASHYIRTDYTNNNEIHSKTILEQIFEAKFLKLLLLPNEENIIQQKSSKCSKELIQTPGKR